MSTTIKVNVTDLLNAVKEKRQAVANAAAEESATYRGAREVYDRARRGALTEALKQASAELRSTGRAAVGSHYFDDDRRRQCLFVPIPDGLLPDCPRKPTPPDLSKFDKDIALLEMSAEDTLRIGVTSNWSKYL